MNARALRHPLFWVSLVGLIANDHVLKSAPWFPHPIAGKLSDFFGIVVAAAVLSSLTRERRARIAAHVLLAVGFSAFELIAPVTEAVRALYGALGLGFHATRDVSDLVGLVMVPIAFAAFAPTRVSHDLERLDAATQASGARRFMARSTFAVSLLASLASVDVPPPGECPASDCDADGFGPDVDCNDADATVNPAAGNCPGDNAEACNDGLDNDGNGAIDCDDAACVGACADTEAACTTDLTITPSDTALVGSTLSGTWALQGSCGGADSPERVFRFELIEPSTLRVELPPGHVVYLRQDCTDEFDELACADPDVIGTDALTANLPPGSYALIVDAKDGLTAGDFDFELDWGCEAAPDLEAGPLLEDPPPSDWTECGASTEELRRTFTSVENGTLTVTATAEIAPIWISATHGCGEPLELCTGPDPGLDPPATRASFDLLAGESIDVYFGREVDPKPAGPPAPINVALEWVPETPNP